MFALHHLALIRVEGQDAVPFLNAQFCNTLPAQDATPDDAEGSVSLNAWCSAAGKVIATFVIIRYEGCCYLLLPACLSPGVCQGLSRYIFRSQVVIQDISRERILLGSDRTEAMALLARSGKTRWSPSGHFGCTSEAWAFALPYDGKRHVAVLPHDAKSKSDNAGASKSALLWRHMDLVMGMPWLHAVSSEQFLPQQLNLDGLQGMSLSKGCYPGQEIIARVHYRSQVKRRLMLAVPEDARVTDIGLQHDCYSSLQGRETGQPCGTVIACFADAAGRPHLHAIVDRAQAEEQGVCLSGVPRQPLRVQRLPGGEQGL